MSINGATVISHFDIIVATGAEYKGVTEQYLATPTSSGIITINFTGVTSDAIVNAIDVYSRITPSDYQGTGHTDYTVYDSTSNAFVVNPATTPNTPSSQYSYPLGINGDNNLPISGDFGNVGKSDYAIYDQSNATFYVDSNTSSLQLGNASNRPIPVAADFFGYGRSSFAIYDPVTSTFYAENPGNLNSQLSMQIGNPGHHPIPAIGDYDGDGKSDFAIYDPVTATFYIDPSSGVPGFQFSIQLGNSSHNNTPIPGDFDGLGVTEPAIYDQNSNDTFFVDENAYYYTQHNLPPATQYSKQLGNASHGNTPVLGIFDLNDPIGRNDFAVFDPITATFYADQATNPNGQYAVQVGNVNHRLSRVLY